MRSTVYAAMCAVIMTAVMLTAGCGKKDDVKDSGVPGEPTAASPAIKPEPLRMPTVNRPARPNVIIILVDALRRDRVSAYRYSRNTTPFIDSLAKDGLLFENAIAQAPWTEPSVASVFTSKYPYQIGVGAKEDKKGRRKLETYLLNGLPESALTLAEVLKKGGYHTGFVNTNGYTDTQVGLTQGFEYYKLVVKAKADVVMDDAMSYIDGLNKDSGAGGGKPPFFLYLHMIDVHEPTDPPAPYDYMYPTLDNAPHDKNAIGWAYMEGKALDTDRFRIYKSHKAALYDGALTFLDSQVKRLVEHLKETGQYDNTMIVIMSDHGDEFWEHAVFEKENMSGLMLRDDRYGIAHGHTMFRELLDVPLIIHGAGIPSGRVVQQVRNIDVMPTVLGLAGVDSKGLNIEGGDLLGLIAEDKLTDLPAYSEDIAMGYEGKCIQDPSYKYIRYYDPDGTEFLFDKVNDPMEKNDISGKAPRVLARYREEFDVLMSGLKAGKSKTVTMDKKAREGLKALGYLQ